MPIYEYQCRACEHAFETIQKISEPVLTECPDCGKEQLKKLVSAAAFRLKGSGWYETDFKSGDKKNVSKSDDSAPSSGTSSEGSSSSDSSKEAKKSDKSESPASKPKNDSKSASS